MDLGSLAVGVLIGILLGAVAVWLVDRRQQQVVKKLVHSRHMVERQRAQAVNDLYALRGELDDAKVHQSSSALEEHTAHDPAMAAELANLRSLIARADGALTAARRKRDEDQTKISLLEDEVGRLSNALEGTGADVIDLRSRDSSSSSSEGLAL